MASISVKDVLNLHTLVNECGKYIFCWDDNNFFMVMTEGLRKKLLKSRLLKDK